MNELHVNNCVELTNTEMCGCLRDEKYNYLEIIFRTNETTVVMVTSDETNRRFSTVT